MSWTFLTNHTRVLLCIASDPAGTRIRDIARCADITERAAHRIVTDLAEAGYITRHRVGARNRYEIHPEMPLRHPYDGAQTVGDILGPLLRQRSDHAHAA